MRKLLILIIAILALPVAIWSQVYPQSEIFIKPGMAPVNTNSVTLNLVGQYTNWTAGAGTAGSPQFVLLGTTGGSLVSQNIVDATHATVVINTGTVTGMAAIQDPTQGTGLTGYAYSGVFWVKNPTWLAPFSEPASSSEQTFVVLGTRSQVNAYNSLGNWTAATQFTISGCPTASISQVSMNAGGAGNTVANSAGLIITAGNTECVGSAIVDSTNGASAPLNFHKPQTWYVRADGGTRYDSSRAGGNLSVQCDGKHDAAYPGSGTNQPCAFNDFRYIYDDQATYRYFNVAIAGGDTVVVDNTKQWRIGFDATASGTANGVGWCPGQSGAIYCATPVLPSGIPSQPTQIVGRNVNSCTTSTGAADPSKMSQLFGGQNLEAELITLKQTHDMVVSCIELTRHSQCSTAGQYNGAEDYTIPRCQTSTAPFDDTASKGIGTDYATEHVTLRNMFIHNFSSRGLQGPIGLGTFLSDHVDIENAESTGVDFDDGTGRSLTNLMPNQDVFGNYSSPFWDFESSTIGWSGCYEEYPFVPSHHIHSIGCYGQNNEGQGDGLGSANAGQEFDLKFGNHSVLKYNVQDGEDVGHNGGSNPHTFTFTNSSAYGNEGSQIKWGWGFTTVFVANNFIESYCDRMSQPIADSVATYGRTVTGSDRCRAGSALSFNLPDNATSTFANNSIISYDPQVIDVSCVPSVTAGANCAHSTMTWENNIVRIHTDFNVTNYNGNNIASTWCGGSCNANGNNNNIGNWVFKNNLYYGADRDCSNGVMSYNNLLANSLTTSNDKCLDPLFAGEPEVSDVSTNQSVLDNYNFTLSPSSPAIHYGVPVAGLTTDFLGNPYNTSTPSIGALEVGSSYYTPVYTGSTLVNLVPVFRSLVIH